MELARQANGHAGPQRGGDRGPEHVAASIGMVLRASRGSRYTIEDLAKLSGVSAGRISELERGLANPFFCDPMEASESTGPAFWGVLH